MWRRPKAAAPVSLTQQFDSAKIRFDLIRQKIEESSLSEEDRQGAHNKNEAEYRKTIERLICHI